MPAWVDQGFRQYADRLRGACSLQLLEIPLTPRTPGVTAATAVAREAGRILDATGSDNQVVALDVTGRSFDTEALAGRLSAWLRESRDVDFIIGGPDGLAPEVLERASLCWSLSPLTFPHGLTRILVAEQLYRAWTILQGHPYHRR